MIPTSLSKMNKEIMRKVWSVKELKIVYILPNGLRAVLSCVQLFATPWTVACQAPLSIEFSRKECWSWLSFSPLGYLPDSGIEPASPALAGKFFTTASAGKHPETDPETSNQGFW